MAMDLEGDPTTLAILSGTKIVTVLLGFLVVYLGWKAYRGSKRRPILWLTIGMAVMTLGAISEAIAFQGLGWGLDQSHIFEGFVTLIAFAFLVYSLYAKA